MPLIGPRHGACYSALRRVNISKLHQKLRTSINLSDVFMHGSYIPRVTTHKHLGVHINSRLSWQDDIDHVYTDCARKIGILCRLQRKIRSTALRKIFIGAIRPQLEYACPVWSGGNTSKLVKLQELFWRRHQNVLPQLQQRFDYHTLVLFFKIKSNLAPPYLTEILPQLFPLWLYFSKKSASCPCCKKVIHTHEFLSTLYYPLEQLAIRHPEQHNTPQV